MLLQEGECLWVAAIEPYRLNGEVVEGRKVDLALCLVEAAWQAVVEEATVLCHLCHWFVYLHAQASLPGCCLSQD